MFFGAEVKKKRLAMMITQTEMAKDLSISPFMISKIERGILLPSVRMFKKICIYLKLDILEMLKYF